MFNPRIRQNVMVLTAPLLQLVVEPCKNDPRVSALALKLRVPEQHFSSSTQDTDEE